MNNYLSTLFIAMLFFFGCGTKRDKAGKGDFEKAVEEAVERQMSIYPESTLKDLYKSFFQDKFGPGHLIPDTVGAGAYLRRELASYDEVGGERFEPVGWEHNFYRVNLSVIKTGLVPYNIFLEAFFKSAQNVSAPSTGDWKREWGEIEKIIRAKNLSLPDYEKDLAEIESNLENGIYMGHHSERYEKAYAPHYRIIGRDMFDKFLRPLIEK
jgi:hypothetical protein